jgi:hypothetical protein
LAAHQHIELNRKFKKFDDSKQAENAAFESYARSDWNVDDGIQWPELLADEQICVILGEPGSGKSHEFKSQVDQIRAKGHCAALIELGQIATNPNPALGQRDTESLRPWFEGNTSATIFLDAVDEAKLARPTDFHAALKHISAWVGSRRFRTRFVISARISAWRVGNDDIWVLEELLSDFSTPKENAKKLNIVRLLPMNSAQVELLLAPIGNDPKAFILAMQDIDAVEFLGRPDDARLLYRIWLEKSHLGTKTEMMEATTVSKLSLDIDRSNLGMSALRHGANAICACLHLTQNLNVQLEDQLASTHTSGIFLRNCLPGSWSEAQRQSLITRPLFDAAAFGLVRVHHRTHQDYLAACWLKDLMQLECRYSELRQLIFATGTGNDLTIRPFMKSVAAWLACIAPTTTRWAQHLLKDLLNHSPFVFFAYGDPHALPIAYRREVLRTTVEKFRGRERVDFEIDTPTVKRFVDANLANDLATWIADKTVSTSVRADYIRMVRKGKLHGALHAVVNIAIDATEPEHLRSPALDCLQNLGKQSDFQRLATAISALTSVTVELAGYFALAAYPRAIEASELFLMLRKLDQEPERFSIGSLDQFENMVLQGSREHQHAISAFLIELIKFVSEGLDGQNLPRLWASKWLHDAAYFVLNASSIDALGEQLVLRVIELLETQRVDEVVRSYGKNPAEMNKLTMAHPSIRQKYFWCEYARAQAQLGRPPSYVYELSKHPYVLSIHARDVAWLAMDAQQCDGAKQAFAIRAILQMHAGKHRTVLPLNFYLKAAWKNRTAMKVIFEEAISPLMDKWFRLRQLKSNMGYKYFWREKSLSIKRPYWHVINKIHFLWKLRAISQGKWWGACHHVLEYARQTEVAAGTISWGNLTRVQVHQPYGARIGEAVLSGIDHLWRQSETPLAHENKAIFARTLHGQFALNFGFLAQGALYFERLSTDEAATATRHALRSLNGLPNWFAALSRAHPAAVHSTVVQAIQGDWHDEDPDALYSATLGNLVSDYPNMCPAIAPVVKQLLLTDPSQKAGLLDQALAVVLAGDVNATSWLSGLAQQGLKQSPHDDAVGSAWLKLLFQLDANRALEFTEKIVLGLGSTVASEFASALCAGLANRYHQRLPIESPDFYRPKFLGDFIPWVYRHVSPATDPQHKGAHQVSTRDETVNFRTSLVRHLASDPSHEAESVLRQLLLAPELAQHRDWLLLLLDQQAQLRANDFRLKPEDVFELYEKHERTPRTRSDLFELSHGRIVAFKEDVELNENSSRHEVQLSSWLEHDYQFWIKKYLDEKSLGRYNTSAEAEVDPKTYPDLRIESSAVNGAVFVEIKVANRWSYNDLMTALESQLIGQYLRAERAQHGIFLLFHTGLDPKNNIKENWEPDGAPKRSWFELLSDLRARADQILQSRRDIESVRVIGIDVRMQSLKGLLLQPSSQP